MTPRVTPTYADDYLARLRIQLGEAISTRQALEFSKVFTADERDQLLKQQDKSIRILDRRINEWVKADKKRGVTP
jgi:hypothetical protein